MKNKEVPNISIVIPCYNIQNEVKTTVENIIENLEKYTSSFEIIIVNAGSTDNTPAVIEDIKNNHQSIQTISYSQNKGKG